jgi:hypothetical protein
MKGQAESSMNLELTARSASKKHICRAGIEFVWAEVVWIPSGGRKDDVGGCW